MAGLLQSRRRLFTRRGRPMTLRRAGADDLAVSGVEADQQPDATSGDVRQTDATIELLNDEIAAASWPAPIRARDQIVVDGQTRQIIGARRLYDGADLIGWRLTVRGGQL